MTILAIDTCGDQCAVAACHPTGAVFVAQHLMTRGQGEALPDLVVAALDDAGIGYRDLERLVVTVGPGSFSGVRVGLALARGLAVVLKIPVLGVSSLRAIAASDGGLRSPAEQLVVIDAKRGEVYAQLFGAGKGPLSEPTAIALAGVMPVIAKHLAATPNGFRLMGSGAALLAEHDDRFAPYLCPNGPVRPDMGALCGLGRELSPGEAPPKPLYVRPPDAKPMVVTDQIRRR